MAAMRHKLACVMTRAIFALTMPHARTDPPPQCRSRTRLRYAYTLEQNAEHKLPVLEKSDDVYADLVNRLLPAEQDVLNIRTFYEQMWLTEGRKIHYVRFALP
jgi:hypothetical protein